MILIHIAKVALLVIALLYSATAFGKIAIGRSPWAGAALFVVALSLGLLAIYL